MRLKVLIPALIVLSLAIAVLFWHRPVQRPAIPEVTQESVQPTNLPGVNAPVATQTVSIPVQTAISQMNSELFITNNTKALDIYKQLVEQRNAPVDFYGQFLDQDGNPISGVNIKVSILHMTLPDPLVPELGSKEIYLQRSSDAAGRFEMHGETGQSIYIESVKKTGYDLEPSRSTYGVVGGSFEHPIIFKMWSTNIHEQLITGEKKFQIVPDGRLYMIDLTQGTIAESGEGDLKVWVKYPSQVTSGQLYDWLSEVDVVNGGLLEEDDLNASMYLAPTDGYAPSFQVQQQIKGGQYGLTGEKRFYVKLKNGQEYGRITINLYAPYTDEIPGLIRLSYVINPSGSMILR